MTKPYFSPDVNTFSLLGTVQNVENKSKEAYAMAIVTLTTDESMNKESGEIKQTTHRVICWHDQARDAISNAIQGDRIFVQGKIAVKSYTRQDGTTSSSTEFSAQKVMISKTSQKIESDPY